MDVAQIVNTDISFSKATLDDILSRYSIKAKDSTSTTNKTPATVKTALSTLRQAYARVHGIKTDDYGDLTWLTMANFRKPGKFVTARPLFEGAAHPDATDAMSVPLEAATIRKNLEVFRSTLYAAAAHLKTLSMADSDRDRLLEQYKAAYSEFGVLSNELFNAEQNRLATREPSQRQQSKWVSWQELNKLLKVVVKSLDATFAAPPATMSTTDNKKMQRSMQFCMQMLLPPVRGGNYAGLRFVAPQGENVETLRETDSPNYILVTDDGPMELVFNRYKVDNRSKAMDYDPEDDFVINTPATKRFAFTADPTLTKFGFDPVKMGQLLQSYRSLQQSLLGELNPHDLVFFEMKKGQPVERVSAEGMSTRMGRIAERLTGQSLGATMLRTVFLTWFNTRKPTMEQREVIAERMMHAVKTQLDTYVKGTIVPPKTKRQPAQDGSGHKRRRVTVKNMRI